MTQFETKSRNVPVKIPDVETSNSPPHANDGTVAALWHAVCKSPIVGAHMVQTGNVADGKSTPH